jgi:hypothetical protein
MPPIARLLPGVAALSFLVTFALAMSELEEAALPSYHYGAPIPVECMNRSM